MIITIDGPTASGKSTVACKIAQHLGYYYLNSGFLYRGLAYLLIKHSDYIQKQLISPDECDVITYLDPQRFTYQFDNTKGPSVLFDGTDISLYFKDNIISQAASLLSTNKIVRTHLLNRQRMLGKRYNLVTDGRDMGSIIFPDALYKFYLTADFVVRAQRWQIHQKQLGIDITSVQAQQEIQNRDERDTKRAIAPLLIPDKAHNIDSSLLTINEVINTILMHIKI